ncbi:MAG TPA: FaeA/PapI family transcriptional regulator [Streptosporangiaceae bacterium]|nr:FaeA/PapI family transcriptional regulator [Streptosporangiaceae bacterium]
MACVTAEGTLTASGQRLLTAVAQPATAPEVAEVTGLPLYQVRSGLRELTVAGLIAETSGRYQRLDAGPSRGGS